MKSIPVVVWKSDSSVTHCLICDLIFSLFKRKHHCRYCGEIICDKCSLNRIQINKSQGAVRICDLCVSIKFGGGTYNDSDKNNNKYVEKLNVKVMTNNNSHDVNHNVNVAIDDDNDNNRSISVTHNAAISSGDGDSRDGMNVWKSPIKSQHNNNSSDLFSSSILSIYSLDDYYIRLCYDDNSTIHSIIDQLQSLIKISSIHIGIFELCQIKGGSRTFHPISLHVRIIDLFDEWRNVYSMHGYGGGKGTGSSSNGVSGSTSASNRIGIYNDTTHDDDNNNDAVDNAVVLKLVIPLYYKNLYPSALMESVHDNSYRQSMYRYRQPSIEIVNNNNRDPLHADDNDHHHHVHDDDHDDVHHNHNHNDIDNNGVPPRNQQLILASLIEKQHRHGYNKTDGDDHNDDDNDDDDNDEDDEHHHFNKHEYYDNQYNSNCDTTWISIDSCAADQLNNNNNNNNSSNHINYRSRPHHHRINSVMKHNHHNHDTNSKSFELLTTLSNHIQPIDHEDDDSNSSVESSSPAKILMNLQEFSIHENRRRSSGQFSGHSPVRTSLAAATATTRRMSNPVFYSR